MHYSWALRISKSIIWTICISLTHPVNRKRIVHVACRPKQKNIKTHKWQSCTVIMNVRTSSCFSVMYSIMSRVWLVPIHLWHQVHNGKQTVHRTSVSNTITSYRYRRDWLSLQCVMVMRCLVSTMGMQHFNSLTYALEKSGMIIMIEILTPLKYKISRLEQQLLAGQQSCDKNG